MSDGDTEKTPRHQREREEAIQEARANLVEIAQRMEAFERLKGRFSELTGKQEALKSLRAEAEQVSDEIDAHGAEFGCTHMDDLSARITLVKGALGRSEVATTAQAVASMEAELNTEAAAVAELQKTTIKLAERTSLILGFEAAQEFARKRASRHGWDDATSEENGLRLYRLAMHGPVPSDLTKGRDALDAEWAEVLAPHWPKVFAEWVDQHAHRLGAEAALASLAEKKDEIGIATRPEALPRLREAVVTELTRTEFKTAVGWPWPEAHEETVTDGMPAPLAALLAHMHVWFCQQPEGPVNNWLESTATKARSRLEEWNNQETLEGMGRPDSPWVRLTPAKAAELVAHVVWLDRVREELKREATSAAALVTTVSAGVGSIWAADTRQCELELMDTTGANVAWLAVDTAENAAQLFKGGSSLTFQRLIRYLPVEAHRLWRQTGRDQADVIIEGGFSALAKLIGAHSKKAAEQVREALQLGQVLRRHWADGTEAGGLWTVLSQPHAPGRPARLTITLSPILRPGFTYQLPKGPTRALVPVVPLPPLTGRERDHASQAQLQWSVMQRLVEGRSETARKGGVTFKADDWRRLCEKNGLPPSTFPRVIAAWEGRFLERVGADRWFVADTPEFTAARRHLMVQAEEHAGQAERGRRSAAKKRRQRAKRSKPKAV